MPTAQYTRERVGRFRLLNTAANACRYIEIADGAAEVECPRCAETIRTYELHRPRLTEEGGPVWRALVDHLFHECPAVEVTR